MKIFKSKAQREAERVQKQREKDRTTVRKPEDIGKEYTALCGEAGDKQYRIKVLTMELEQVNQRLNFLNQEFHRAQAAHKPTADEAKALAAAVKPVEPDIQAAPPIETHNAPEAVQ